MSEMFAILGLILFGPGLLSYVYFLVRQSQWKQSVPLIEAVIDRAVGIEPPPRNRTDHFFMRLQLIAMSFVGLIVTGLGLIILLEFFGFTE